MPYNPEDAFKPRHPQGEFVTADTVPDEGLDPEQAFIAKQEAERMETAAEETVRVGSPSDEDLSVLANLKARLKKAGMQISEGKAWSKRKAERDKEKNKKAA